MINKTSRNRGRNSKRLYHSGTSVKAHLMNDFDVIPTPSRLQDLTGLQFNKLLVLGFLSKNSKSQTRWLCRCECGTLTVVRGGNLKNGHTKSCGECVNHITNEQYDSLIASRILEHIHITESGCWEWQKGRHEFGYGWVSYRGRSQTAHTLSYKLFCGPTNGMYVLHKCDNPSCCYPLHLFLGTQQDNIRDAMLKGRMPHGESHWNATLTDSQVALIREMHRQGSPYCDISNAVQCSDVTVCKIITGHAWRHVE